MKRHFLCVPQGSTLGPLLFLLYVNDMPAAVKCKFLLYADDSALFITDKDISEIEEARSLELVSVSDWLMENKLSLHIGKTESILFASKRRLQNVKEIKMVCNGDVLGSRYTYMQ